MKDNYDEGISKMKHNNKVLILTHALGPNYGGILQAYALQVCVKRQGVDPATSNYHSIWMKEWVVAHVRYMIRRVVHYIKPSISDLPPFVDKYTVNKTLRFVDKYMSLVPMYELRNPKFVTNYSTLIVGSDQVWRQAYVPVDKYMFDFAENLDIKRISYAASFGRDDLSEYSPELIVKTARLAKKFDAISVREDTGVNIVKQYWGVKADQHVDPTLLLDKEHYEVLIAEDEQNVTKSEGDLFAYVLDRDDKKERLIDDAAKALDLTPFEIMPPKPTSRKELKNNLDKFQLPPVTQWLKSFQDAKFVITDSFHGCAFSIIFNKPFIAIGNKRRGMARFTSLLKLFGLEDRLVSDVSDVTEELLKSKIDWKKVNGTIIEEKVRSTNYLRRYLC